MKIKVILILVVSMVFSSLIAAELPSHPLTFQNWKRLQVHDSTQEVVKLSKEINGLVSLQNESGNASDENQKQLMKEIKNKKNEQKTKLENLQYSKQLNFEDYFDVYLSKFSGNKEALDYIAKRLSKNSVAYLLQRSIDKGEKPKAIVKKANTSKE